MLERSRPESAVTPARAPGLRPPAARLGSLAIRALYQELALAHKPGLVGPLDAGSHRDMNFHTFFRSLQALRGYFPAIAQLGAALAEFAALRSLGMIAEAAMLEATGGVNTHRGGIFNLGLLCAAGGALAASGQPLSAANVCAEVATRWGDAIRLSGATAQDSHGQRVARRYGCGGARAEAAGGFASALGLGLPAYRAALAATGSAELAATQCLFSLMAEVDDTNLLWRGGLIGQQFVRSQARHFLAAGGVLAADWQARASTVHRAVVARRLSPGGSADLLGVTLFLAAL